MEKITLIFGRSNTLASAAIRLFTWSRWSHVGIVHGDMVIEATARHGVTLTPLLQFRQRYSAWAMADMPVEDRMEAINLALLQVGKPYDWSGIFGIFLRTGWSKPDRWFCSELVAYVSQLFRKDRISRIRPEHIWSLSK